MLCLALEILSEELNALLVHAGGFSPSVADVILMRFSIVHKHFMMLLYEKQTKPKAAFSGRWCLFWSGSHAQSVCWGGFSMVSPSVLVPVVAGVSPHGVELCLSDHGCRKCLCKALAGWFSPWSMEFPFWLLVLSSARTWQCLAGTDLILCRSRAPELLGRTSIPFYSIFWRMEVFFYGTGRAVTWGDPAGAGEWRKQAAARDAAAVPEPAEHRDQRCSGNHRHRLRAGKTRWCRAGAEAGMLSVSLRACAKEVAPKGN